MGSDKFTRNIKTSLYLEKTLDIFISGCYKMRKDKINLELGIPTFTVSYKTKRGDWIERNLGNIVKDIGGMETLDKVKNGGVKLPNSLEVTSPLGEIEFTKKSYDLFLPFYLINLTIWAKNEEEYYANFERLEKYFK